MKVQNFLQFSLNENEGKKKNNQRSDDQSYFFFMLPFEIFKV